MGDSSGGGRDGEEEPTSGARYGGDEAGAAPAAGAASPTEVHLFHLVEMGYAEDQALAAVLDAHGNFDQALDILSTLTAESNPTGVTAQVQVAPRDDVTASSPTTSPIVATGPAGGEDKPSGGRDGGQGSQGGASYGGGEAGATPAAMSTTPTDVLVAQLVEMGYAEDHALAALLDAHGNLHQALDTLSTQTAQNEQTSPPQNDARNTGATDPVADLHPRDLQNKMRDLPDPVRRDVTELVTKLDRRIDDDARKKLIDAITTSICAKMSQNEGIVGPDVLSSEFSSAASAVCQPSQVASVLRGHKWHTGGSSAWSTFKSGGAVLETFKDATSKLSQRAQDVFKRLREKMSGRPSATPEGTTSAKPADRTEPSTPKGEDDSGERSFKQAEPATDGDHSPPDGSTEQEPDIPVDDEKKDDSSGVLHVDSSAQGGVEFQENVDVASAENKIDVGAHAQCGEAAVNAGTAGAQIGRIGANADASGAKINAGNATAQAFDVQASATTQGGEVNAGNANATAVQVTATANAGGGAVNTGNVTANLVNVNAGVSAQPSANVGNANFALISVNAVVEPPSLDLGNVGIGFGVGLPWGGGGGGGGGEGGGGGGAGGGGGGGAGGGKGGGPGDGGGGGGGGGGSGGNGSNTGGNSFRGRGNNALHNAHNAAQERLPNYHIQPDGRVFRNGKLHKILERGKKKDTPQKSPEITYDPVEGHEVESVTDPLTGEPRQVRDPHGIPRDEQVNQVGDSAHMEVMGEKAPLFSRDEGNTGGGNRAQGHTSCIQWANVIQSKLRNIKRLGGVTATNARAHAEIHLSKSGRTLLIDLEPTHVFAATGHGDHVVVTNLWQSRHVIRNEPGMPRNQFLDNFHTLLNTPDSARRQTASRVLFNCDSTDFNANSPKIRSIMVGDQGDPIVPNRNINRNIEGIQQDNHPEVAVRGRDFHFRGGIDSAEDQVDATGDGVPDDSKDSEATVDHSTRDDDEEQVQAMVREMMLNAGFPDDMYDMSMLSDATAASRAAGLPEEDEEPFELCDYCRGLGYAGCMKCLLGRGNSGKKIVRKGNLASFKD